MSTKATDILILHGKSTALVSELKAILHALDLSAGTVLDQPSGKNLQKERVLEKIKTCKLALVLATFDEDSPNSRTPRANVMHELTLCLERRPKETVVLQEAKEGILVDLGSNLGGQLITINFSQGHLHEAYPQLFRELRARSFLAPRAFARRSIGSPGFTTKCATQFLDKMDALWLHFDTQCDRIRRDDYQTLLHYNDNLDRFFVAYWNVFDAMLRKAQHPSDFALNCDKQYDASLVFLEHVCHDTTYRNMYLAESLMRKNRRRLPAAFVASFHKTDKKLKGIRKNANIRSRIKTYLEIGKELDGFITKLETVA